KQRQRIGSFAHNTQGRPQIAHPDQIIEEETRRKQSCCPSQPCDALKRKRRNPQAQRMYTPSADLQFVKEKVWRKVLEWTPSFGKRRSFECWPRAGGTGLVLWKPQARTESPFVLELESKFDSGIGYQAPFRSTRWGRHRRRKRYVVDSYPGKGPDNSITPTSTVSTNIGNDDRLGGGTNAAQPTHSFDLATVVALQIAQSVGQTAYTALDDFTLIWIG
ncbi:hypothetical protein MJO28_010519, partial [Puccinia striiformis f. sp. tritici]